jgi:hypothetical protein
MGISLFTNPHCVMRKAIYGVSNICTASRSLSTYFSEGTLNFLEVDAVEHCWNVSDDNRHRWVLHVIMTSNCATGNGTILLSTVLPFNTYDRYPAFSYIGYNRHTRNFRRLIGNVRITCICLILWDLPFAYVPTVAHLPNAWVGRPLWYSLLVLPPQKNYLTLKHAYFNASSLFPRGPRG